MTTYYMLTETGRLGTTTTGEDEDGPFIIVTDPRRLVPSTVIEDDVEQSLLPLADRTYCLAVLEPCGPVEAGECPDGWRVARLDGNLDPMLGPQAAQIRPVVAEAERVLIDDGDGETAQAYAAAIDAVYEQGYPEAERMAVEALDAYGADGLWWNEIGACAYGGEVKALAARDLIGAVPGWTQEAYDLLTGPWVAAFGRPVHPDDKIPASTGTEGN